MATLAARDQGYVVRHNTGIYLDELRTKEGKEPYPGYASIALYVDVHIVKAYSIRVATGDVIETTRCEVLRYPDLLQYKRESNFGVKDVTLAQLAKKVGCQKLSVFPRKGLGGR